MKVKSEMNPIPNSQFLIPYTLHLADNALILGHRNSEWCGHGPVLEQDIAITNISLDLIGQARNFYQYAAQIINKSQKSESSEVSPLGATDPPNGGEGWERSSLEGATEDTLAYLRDTHQFTNCLLVEQPNGDWAQTILRQFFFSNYLYLLYGQLQNSPDEQLAAIAAKGLKEVTYHLRWSSEWVIRLGDGTEESHARMLKAIDQLSGYTGELFEAAAYEAQAVENGIGVDLNLLRLKWKEKVKEVFIEAALPVPGKTPGHTGGKEGKHSEHLSTILSEMQFLQRTYPNSTW